MQTSVKIMLKKSSRAEKKKGGEALDAKSLGETIRVIIKYDTQLRLPQNNKGIN